MQTKTWGIKEALFTAYEIVNSCSHYGISMNIYHTFLRNVNISQKKQNYPYDAALGIYPKNSKSTNHKDTSPSCLFTIHNSQDMEPT